MSKDLLVTKSFNKGYYSLNEIGTIEVRIVNNKNYIIEKVRYKEALNNYYEILTEEITLNNERYSIDMDKTIYIDSIGSMNEVILTIKFKAISTNLTGIINSKGIITYEELDFQEVLVVEEKLIIKGVQLELKEFIRDKEVLFDNDVCNYQITIINRGNVVASNVIFKYISSGNLNTYKGEVIVDDVYCKGIFVENSINIGSIFKGEERSIKFSVKMKNVQRINDFDYLEMRYDAVINPNLPIERKCIKFKKEPLVLVRDNIEIQKSGYLKVIDNKYRFYVETLITNKSLVTINDFRLRENFNCKGEILQLEIDNNKNLYREGQDIIISEILNNESCKIKYILAISSNENKEFNLWSTAIYNIGNEHKERRYKKDSNKLVEEIQNNILVIESSTDKERVQINEDFNGEIKLINLSEYKILRSTVFIIGTEVIGIVKGSFKFNNHRINNIDTLQDGLDIGEIEPYEEIIINYKGYFKNIINSRNVDITIFAKYIIDELSGDNRHLKSNIIEKSIIVDRVKYKSLLEKVLELKSILIERIIAINPIGKIIDCRAMFGTKSMEAKVLINKGLNYLVVGIIEVNIEYEPKYQKNKVMNLNVQIPFRELVSEEFKGINSDISFAEVQITNSNYNLYQNKLNLIFDIEISL